MYSKRPTLMLGLTILVLLALSCSLPQSLGGQAPDAQLNRTIEALSTQVAGQAGQPAQATEQPPAPAEATQAPPAEVVPPASTETQVPSATPISHSLIPAQPGWTARWFTDINSSSTAAEKRSPGGDDLSKNRLERPFTQTDMAYRPDLDIVKAEISSDSNFYYVTIYLSGTNPQAGTLQASYGVELDTDQDGRGNYLVLASNPTSTAWQMENVTVYKDTDFSVGGARPMAADAPAPYVGYDQVVFSLEQLQDPDAAWARVSPKGNTVVELAFKPSLIGGAGAFLWGVWADDGVKDPAKFDYNDHFTQAEAGLPYTGADYPIKALYQVDNTCREVFGFTPVAPIPGLCALPPTVTPTPTTPPNPGRITGSIFGDYNGNGRRDSDDIPFCGGGVVITLSGGPCGSGGFAMNLPVSSGSCTFSANNLTAGQYCVHGTGVEYTTPTDLNVTVTAGGTASVEFGMRVIY